MRRYLSSALWFGILCLTYTGHVSALWEDLRITNTEISPDGFPRISTLANGVFPSPLLKVYKGDSFHINVYDELNNSAYDTVTSIHWHGLNQRHSNWADGPAFVNQCPIIPGNAFSYDFSVPGQTGTYWYHSHYSLQYCDGLRGPLVIYDPEDPLLHLYDYDDESTIVTLADWYHLPASQVPLPAIADATLINGLGRWSGNLTAPLSIINVVQTKRYRLRLVSISCEPAYTFSIDGHNLTVIEADGVETEPIEVDSVQIFASQRYSLILNANQPVNNYWIRAQPNEGNTTFIGGINSAILRYSGASDSDPTTTQTPSVAPLVETNLHPYQFVPIPGYPWPGGVTSPLNFSLGTAFIDNQFEFTINNSSFIKPPDVPILLQILSGTTDPQQLLPTGSIFTIPPHTGQTTVEITMNGGVVGGPHPFHLHGQNFHVVRSAGSSEYNYFNPVIRDTVNTGTNTSDVTVIRFIADNPGPWFIHCHIDFHLNLGFAAVIVEDIDQVGKTDPAPPEWYQLCPAYYNYIQDQMRSTMRINPNLD